MTGFSLTTDFPRFRDFVSGFGDMSWAVLFVKADLETVAQQFALIVDGRIQFDLPIVIDTLIRPTTSVILVSFKADAWVMVVRAVGRSVESHAQTLSQALPVDILCYQADDCSGVELVTLFSDGKAKTEFRTGIANEMVDDAGREDPLSGLELPEVEMVALYQHVFERFGVPLCPVSADEQRVVIQSQADFDRIHRVAVIEPR